MTREAEERERPLRGDLEQLRSQQEQTLWTVDTRIDALMERRTQAIMDSLDGLQWNRRGSRNRGTHSREASRELRVNFDENPNRGRSYGSTRGRGNSSSNATGNNRPRGQTNTRGGSIDSRPISSERLMRDANATGRSVSTNWNHSNQGRSQPSDSDRRKILEPKSTDNNDQAGHHVKIAINVLVISRSRWRLQ